MQIFSEHFNLNHRNVQSFSKNARWWQQFRDIKSDPRHGYEQAEKLQDSWYIKILIQ
jgi:hypothetical protein